MSLNLTNHKINIFDTSKVKSNVNYQGNSMSYNETSLTLMSSIPNKTPEGNDTKYLSYKEAWSRIKKAQKQGFYLEAVTLQESIITDRLISYLVGVGFIQRAVEPNNYPGFGQLINKWKAQHPNQINIQDYSDLQTAVDEWRIKRNKVVHGMVKSHPGEATESVIDFLEEAKLTAEQGEQLARAVSYWVKKINPQA